MCIDTFFFHTLPSSLRLWKLESTETIALITMVLDTNRKGCYLFFDLWMIAPLVHHPYDILPVICFHCCNEHCGLVGPPSLPLLSSTLNQLPWMKSIDTYLYICFLTNDILSLGCSQECLTWFEPTINFTRPSGNPSFPLRWRPGGLEDWVARWSHLCSLLHLGYQWSLENAAKSDYCDIYIYICWSQIWLQTLKQKNVSHTMKPNVAVNSVAKCGW